MIKELEHAAQRDELGEQTHNPGNDWLAWDSYRKQRERADSALKALERGEDLPWSRSKRHCKFPNMNNRRAIVCFKDVARPGLSEARTQYAKFKSTKVKDPT